ncbi:MAG: transglutaminase-like domain-containing protein [Gemmataceae bacterium]|nr:transglutaminase-like domain-containing protein [Gemmataceae bacterium]
MSVLLLVLLAADAKEPPLLAWAKAAQGRWAYGLYIKGKKAGWSLDEIKVAKRDGKDVLVSSTESVLATQFDGVKSRKESRTTVTYSLEGEGPILHALAWKKDDATEVTREATAAKDGLRIVTTPKGGKPRTVPVPKDTLARHRELERWLAGKRTKGDKAVKWGTAWEQTDIDDKETYRFKGRKKARVDGKEVEVVEATIEAEGSRMEADLLPDGRPVRAVLGGFLEMRQEPEKEARKLDGKEVDLLNEASVELDADLGPAARLIDELVLEVRGLGDLKVLESHRQAVIRRKGFDAVTLKRDRRVKEAAPLGKEEARRWLEATPRIESGDARIKGKAQEIVGAEKEAGKRAEKLMGWVFAALRKSYEDNADTSTAVLANKAGDCTEHSLLYVALARSLGIPAREVGGLAYVRAKKPLLGWHAWAEIHDGHQWVSVDPTWGQYLVDGAHWKMSEGERDLAWVNVVGALKAKVSSSTRRGR